MYILGILEKTDYAIIILNSNADKQTLCSTIHAWYCLWWFFHHDMAQYNPVLYDMIWNYITWYIACNRTVIMIWANITWYCMPQDKSINMGLMWCFDFSKYPTHLHPVGEVWRAHSTIGRDFCLKIFDTFSWTSVHELKMSALSWSQLTLQMLTLQTKIL